MKLPEHIANLIKRYPTANNLNAVSEYTKSLKNVKTKTKVIQTESEGEALLLFQLKALNLPEPVREYRFDAKRRYRFDFAYPDKMIAVEVEGWGRHQKYIGYSQDCKKYNLASSLGWTVLRYTTKQVKDGDAINEIERMLKA
jgi:very-short-patch-repair endonuclease